MKKGKSMKSFEATWESLQNYKCPDWFRDAKFGIWAHWGPQAVPMAGDWYARNMYREGDPQYNHHVRSYGHPSKFGYKDIIGLWKAEKFDPGKMIDFYRGCGAKYFVALAGHHDNFDCWNSKHHKWNSVNYGPGMDIVGEWCKAARAAGLRFGVTEHIERCWSWFNTNKGADKTGPWAGIPYDGNNPEYVDLYTEPHSGDEYWYPDNASESWKRHWQARIADLIEKYDPDLLYTDGGIPFGAIGLEMVANYYNRNQARRNGILEAVYALKDPSMFKGDHGEYREGIGILDMERGVVDGISAKPWQTDTCIGGWYYDLRREYKTPAEIIHMLADIVSKNGNLLLNFPLRPDGTLDEQAEWTAKEIGKWLKVNGEAIYGTRPWDVYGEGSTQLKAGAFAEHEKKTFSPEDIRFTRKGNSIFAIILGRPGHEVVIRSITSGDFSKVQMLGNDTALKWRSDKSGMHVSIPEEIKGSLAWVLKIDCR